MSNVIVGTAGHVDHGKTCLIKALTGIDADRLKEEHRRGITIELGFADMRSPDGSDIGIIDVPGHEKFIKNMLAGIGGIDLVLLVVAADEGVMPQTVEHLDIMKLLNIKRGIIVITKADTVEKDFIELVEDDIRAAVKGSFLENAPVMAVSSVTGQGIEELKNLIFEMARDAKQRNNNPAILRMPIDRVFTISGFGTVVTGTLMEGSLKVGQDVMIYPQQLSAKVRTLQIHGQMVDKSLAGQRTAVNLQNIKKEELSRGNILAAPDSLKLSYFADVKLRVLEDSKRTITTNSRLHFYFGSDDVLCRAILLDKQELKAGESGYAQLRFERQIALKLKDPFVVRYYSPLETIGGGVILNADSDKHKAGDAALIEALKIRESGDDQSTLEQCLKDTSGGFITIEQLAKQLGMSEDEASSHLQELAANGRAVKLSENLFVHATYIEQIQEKAAQLLQLFHSQNPLLAGMLKAEFRSKLTAMTKIKNSKYADAVINYLGDIAAFKVGVNSVADNNFCVTYTKAQQKYMKTLKDKYEAAGVESPELDAVLADFANKQEGRHILLALESEGVLTKISASGNYISTLLLLDIIEKIKAKITADGSITLAELRDMLNTSRKYALLILGYCDAIKLTRMDGDKRVFC